MRYYELLSVLRPTLTEQEMKDKVDFIKEVLEKNGAEIAAIQNMGVRKLAYPVKKFGRGSYSVFYFKVAAAAIGEVERIIRINEEFIKFLTVKYENKKEIAYWEKSVANVLNKSKKEETALKTEEKEPIEA